MCFLFFFFNDTATTEIYTLSLHDALPILAGDRHQRLDDDVVRGRQLAHPREVNVEHEYGGRRLREGVLQLVADTKFHVDRKSTRLNSSHVEISYAVFCLKKKKKN